MSQYVKVNADDRIIQFVGRPEPEGMGPAAPSPYLDDEDGTWHLVVAGLDWSGRPSDTAVMMWNGGAPAWVETVSPDEVAARVIAAVDVEGDAARLRVIGDPTKVLEYQRAEAQARPYAAAGYPDPAPPCVASWALAKRWTSADGGPWTGQQAADDIIATADRWNGALEGIRALRLDAKEHVRAVVVAGGTPAEIEAIGRQFSTDLSNLMRGLA